MADKRWNPKGLNHNSGLECGHRKAIITVQFQEFKTIYCDEPTAQQFNLSSQIEIDIIGRAFHESTKPSRKSYEAGQRDSRIEERHERGHTRVKWNEIRLDWQCSFTESASGVVAEKDIAFPINIRSPYVTLPRGSRRENCGKWSSSRGGRIGIAAKEAQDLLTDVWLGSDGGGA
jgi:hypothetical protein